MDIETLTSFFMWMAIVNAGILIFGAVLFGVAGDFVYAVRGKIFHMSRESFDNTTYAFVSAYKVLWIVFNVVPYVALRIIA